jgi:gamma-glutamyltranspeptidase / glutathione hydrolase
VSCPFQIFALSHRKTNHTYANQLYFCYGLMPRRKLLLATFILLGLFLLVGLFCLRATLEQSAYFWPNAGVRAPRAMVVSDDRLADQAGIDILKAGGNAVDAAVAVGFALAVVEPGAGNIGGGGFMLIRKSTGQAMFVDYRETAPQHANRDMYPTSSAGSDNDPSRVGYRAVAVPGTVAGLSLALHTYGTMSLAQVILPAIHLAENGFPIDDRLAHSLHNDAATLSLFPVTKRIFLNNGGELRTGEIFRQPVLARTLRRIASYGPDEFYRGETAHHLAEEMQQNGGLITLEDLAAYSPKIRVPLRAAYAYHGHVWEVITSPPPSSGGIAIIEALNILDPIPLKSWGDASSVHWVAEAMRRVFADRATWLADSDGSPVPVAGLTNPHYAAQLRATIDPAEATRSHLVRAGNPIPFDSPAETSTAQPQPLSPASAADWTVREASRPGHTTHFSIVDAAGNAVSNTYTLNDWYGSGVTTSDGYLLNDEMDDFTAHPGKPNMYGLIQSEANTIGPGKRPLSSMTPTIVLRDGQLSFVTGSPGGAMIISATLLTVVNWIRFGMDAQAAINAPRFHLQWIPDKLILEPGVPASVAFGLMRHGYVLNPPFWRRTFLNPPIRIGQVEAIGIDPLNGDRLGAPDPRRRGVALGY